MKNFKKIVTLMLVLVVLAASFCACNKNQDKQGEQGEQVEQGEQTTRPVIDQNDGVSEPGVISGDENLSEEEIPVCQLVIIDPVDIAVTVGSEHFNGSKDVFNAKTDELESESKPIIQEFSHSGKVFIGKTDESFRYGDVITITPTTAISTPIDYSLRGVKVDVGAKADKVASASLSLATHMMDLSGVVGDFSYNMSRSDDDVSRDLMIDGSVSGLSDIEIRCDGDAYLVSSTSPIERLMVRIMDMSFGIREDGKADRGHNDYMASARGSACNYKIFFNDSGELVVETVEIDKDANSVG